MLIEVHDDHIAHKQPFNLFHIEHFLIH